MRNQGLYYAAKMGGHERDALYLPNVPNQE
jgi:hypothetical protein